MTDRFHDLVDMQQQACATFADAELFGTKGDDGWNWITYRAFAERVDAVRAGLMGAGLGEGDSVAVIAGNRTEWAVCAYATYGLGGHYTPMYEHQQEGDWRYIVADSDARALIVSTTAIYGRVRSWPDEIDCLERVYCMELPDDDPHSLASLEATGRAHPRSAAPIDADDVCGLIYTSGTTGKPKGVVLTHDNIVSNVNAVHTFMPMDRSDRSVSFLPWAHSFGQTVELHCLLSMGASMAFAESVPKLLENFAEVRPTLMFAVPRIFNKIYDGVHKKMAAAGGMKLRVFEAAVANAKARRALEDKGRTSLGIDVKHALFDKLVFSKIRARFGGRLAFAFSGGAALSEEVARFIDDTGITVFEGYGLTETSPIACANRPGARRIGSVGQPIPRVEVRIDIDAEGAGGDGQGEILIRGPNIMRGYHKLPEQTAEVIDADGWFRSGDRGRIDADGFVWITGRIKEQYKLENGKYVVPAPLEELLQLSPLVSQAFVHGDGRPYNVALIVPDRDAITAWARTHDVAEKWPALLEDAGVHAAVLAEVERCGSTFRGYERPRRIALLAEEFSVDNGMLTPKMSLRRRVVMAQLGSMVEQLYAGENGDAC